MRRRDRALGAFGELIGREAVARARPGFDIRLPRNHRRVSRNRANPRGSDHFRAERGNANEEGKEKQQVGAEHAGDVTQGNGLEKPQIATGVILSQMSRSGFFLVPE